MMTDDRHEGDSSHRGYISADLILFLIASVFSWYSASRFRKQRFRMPPASPASTSCSTARRSQSGCLRNADDRLVPVSTSVRISLEQARQPAGSLVLPRATIVERLQRHAGLHHRRQLPREDGDVLLL